MTSSLVQTGVQLKVVDHPLVASRLVDLRDQLNPRSVFRMALTDLSMMLIYESMRDVEVDLVDVATPLVTTQGRRVKRTPLLVPVLRAGLGMVEAAQRLLPESSVGFVGLARDEVTHLPVSYMEKLPDDLSDTPVLVLDPMLATGGSLAHCIELLAKRGARDITVACVLAAPEGVQRISEMDIAVRIFTASLDEKLNDSAFIVPGLGDAGDRQFGEA